jgi:hypothetical protein
MCSLHFTIHWANAFEKEIKHSTILVGAAAAAAAFEDEVQWIGLPTPLANKV